MIILHREYPMSKVRAKGGEIINMLLTPKSGEGVGVCHDITKPMPCRNLSFIRKRARMFTHGAEQREFVKSHDYIFVSKHVTKH